MSENYPSGLSLSLFQAGNATFPSSQKVVCSSSYALARSPQKGASPSLAVSSLRGFALRLVPLPLQSPDLAAASRATVSASQTSPPSPAYSFVLPVAQCTGLSCLDGQRFTSVARPRVARHRPQWLRTLGR